MAQKVVDTVSQALSQTIDRSTFMRELVQSVYAFLFNNPAPKTLKYLQYIGMLYLLKQSIILSKRLGSYLASGKRYVDSRVGFDPNEFRDRFGVKYWTLIVGADNEFGRQFSKELSSLGFDLILVGTNQNTLMQREKEVKGINQYIKVQIIATNLFYKNSIEQIQKETDGLEIGLIINNTQMFIYDSYEKIGRQALVDCMNSNVDIMVQICQLFVPKMMKRGFKGGIINVTSGFGFMTVPYTGLYSVGNCFADVFSRGLANQCRGRIDVLSLRLFSVLGGELKVFKKNSEHDYVKSAMKVLGKQDVAYGTFKQQIYAMHHKGICPERSLKQAYQQVNQSVPAQYKM